MLKSFLAAEKKKFLSAALFVFVERLIIVTVQISDNISVVASRVSTRSNMAKKFQMIYEILLISLPMSQLYSVYPAAQ